MVDSVNFRYWLTSFAVTIVAISNPLCIKLVKSYTEDFAKLPIKIKRLLVACFIQISQKMGNKDKFLYPDIISAAFLGNFNDFKKTPFAVKELRTQEIAVRSIPLGNLGVKKD